jgi:hypothetical protein
MADLRLFTARMSPLANGKKPVLGGVYSELLWDGGDRLGIDFVSDRVGIGIAGLAEMIWNGASVSRARAYAGVRLRLGCFHTVQFYALPKEKPHDVQRGRYEAYRSPTAKELALDVSMHYEKSARRLDGLCA